MVNASVNQQWELSVFNQLQNMNLKILFEFQYTFKQQFIWDQKHILLGNNWKNMFPPRSFVSITTKPMWFNFNWVHISIKLCYFVAKLQFKIWVAKIHFRLVVQVWYCLSGSSFDITIFFIFSWPISHPRFNWMILSSSIEIYIDDLWY